jgi:hypothetical protein
MWFRKTLLDDMIHWIKKATKTTVSISDIEFYSSKLESIYSICNSCIGKEEYTFISNALSAKMDTDQYVTMNTDDTS